jgi:DNA-directed RNA polymerase specialized sigma24 family protein
MESVPDSAAEASTGSSAEMVAPKTAQLVLLRAAFKLLREQDPETVAVLEMTVLAGRTSPDVARQLKMQAATVRQKKSRGLKWLREFMDQEMPT